MKQASNVEFNGFIQGLITEASPLNFPANASLDEENFVLDKKGIRYRRYGLDFENGFSYINSFLDIDSLRNNPPVSFKWDQPGGVLDKTFIVIQEKNIVHFFDDSTSVLSATGYLGYITLTDFPSNVQFSITAVDGRLIVASGVEKLCLIEYKNSVLSHGYYNLKVRDTWGVEVTGIPQYETDATYRGAYDPKHYYNLQNQSWGIPRKNSDGNLIDPITTYASHNPSDPNYPSNSEPVWPGLQFQPVTSGTPFERMYPDLYTDSRGVGVKSAKGYFIIDALSRGASRMEAFAVNKIKYPALTYSTVDLPLDITPGGPTVVAEYAGRVWYGGFSGEATLGDQRSPNLSGYILFSQLIRNKADYAKCYQEGDPTSRDNSDIVDTDGGLVKISGMNKLVAMVELGSQLVVIADNGVWSVSGGSDYGFTATNYNVNKISSYGGLTASSIVQDGNQVLFWAEDGIYVVAPNEQGMLNVTNITRATIETYYQSIPIDSKLLVKAAYDNAESKIRWVYTIGNRFTSEVATYELILDPVIKAFYKNKITASTNTECELISVFPSSKFTEIASPIDVVANAIPVVAAGVDVVASSPIATSSVGSVRYLCYRLVGGVLKFTFGYYKNLEFLDWSEDSGGIDAKAFLITGAQIAGDSSKHKQLPYLTMHFAKTETGVTSGGEPVNGSSCLVRSQWDWAVKNLSNKWSPMREMYRFKKQPPPSNFDTGMEVTTSKSKMRGRGRSFALYMETAPGKDCQILGWSLSVDGNAK